MPNKQKIIQVFKTTVFILVSLILTGSAQAKDFLYVLDTAGTFDVVDAEAASLIGNTPLISQFTTLLSKTTPISNALAMSPDQKKIYVAGVGKQAIGILNVDPVGDEPVLEAIPLSDAPGFGMALTEDGSKLYVGVGGGEYKIVVIDTVLKQVVKTIPMGQDIFVYDLAMDGNQLIVAQDTPGNNLTYSLFKLDTTTDQFVGNPVTVADQPKRLIVGPGHKAYVLIEGVFQIFDVNTMVEDKTIFMDANLNPVDLTINPQNTKIYLAYRMTSEIGIYDFNTEQILAQKIQLASSPNAVAFSSDGQKAYVAMANGASILDSASNTVEVANIALIEGGNDLAVVQNGPVNIPVCGNALLEDLEECDDGNNMDGDGCSKSCQKEGDPELCGNKTLDANEECDDGNKISGDGCEANCIKTDPTEPVCGDAKLDTESGEECDDGNLIDNDGCDATCKKEEITGSNGGCSLQQDAQANLILSAFIVFALSVLGGLRYRRNS